VVQGALSGNSDPPSSPDSEVIEPKSKVQKTTAAAKKVAAAPKKPPAPKAKPAPKKKVVAIDDSDEDDGGDVSEEKSAVGKEDVAPVSRPARNRGEKKKYVIEDSEFGSADEDDDFNEDSDDGDDDFDMDD
jgi:hypothetical protein